MSAFGIDAWLSLGACGVVDGYGAVAAWIAGRLQLMDARVDSPSADVVGLVEAACAGGDVSGELARLARCRPDLVRPFHRRLVDADVWWPVDLYRGMDEVTAEYLVQRIEAGAQRPDKLLELLAVGATDTAVEAMWRWDRQPPAWASRLHWPVHRYAHVGGWEFDSAGAVRPLTSTVAFALVPDESGTAAVSGGVLVSWCRWCDLPLWRLLDVDLSTGTLPDITAPEADRVVVASCIRCGCFANVFTEYDTAGSCRWAEDNQRPDFLGHEDPPWQLPTAPPLCIGPPRPTPFAADASRADGSTFGGSPDWLGDPWYPSCPRCHQTMLYVGMITGDDLWSVSSGGCRYLFFDAQCGLAVAVYQN